MATFVPWAVVALLTFSADYYI